MQPPLGGRWFLYHDFYSNPWIFAVTQRFIGIATLLSGNCGISNPILSCALESPESLETTGIAGRRDPEVGSIATHLTFSRLLFDLAHTRPKTCDSEALSVRVSAPRIFAAGVFQSCLSTPGVFLPLFVVTFLTASTLA